jgi:hypothetical protein
MSYPPRSSGGQLSFFVRRRQKLIQLVLNCTMFLLKDESLASPAPRPLKVRREFLGSRRGRKVFVDDISELVPSAQPPDLVNIW